jgi:hypothetical protein
VFLPPIFREFGKAHPDIEVTLSVGVGYAGSGLTVAAMTWIKS